MALVEEHRLVVGQYDPVALLEIGQCVREGRERQRVGAQIHRAGLIALAIADRQRRALPRPDEQIGLLVEQKREGERTAQTRQADRHRLRRRQAAVHRVRDQVRDDLGVGLRHEDMAAGLQIRAQLAEVLDDAIVHHRHFGRRMRMRVDFGRPPMRRPARVADPARAGQRVGAQHGFQVPELALGAPTRQPPVLERRDAGRVVAAIFEPLQRLDEQVRDRLTAEDADDAAHGSSFQAFLVEALASRNVFAQPGFATWRARAITRASAATSSVTTDPVPI